MSRGRSLALMSSARVAAGEGCPSSSSPGGHDLGVGTVFSPGCNRYDPPAFNQA